MLQYPKITVKQLRQQRNPEIKLHIYIYVYVYIRTYLSRNKKYAIIGDQNLTLAHFLI